MLVKRLGKAQLVELAEELDMAAVVQVQVVAAQQCNSALGFQGMAHPFEPWTVQVGEGSATPLPERLAEQGRRAVVASGLFPGPGDQAAAAVQINRVRIRQQQVAAAAPDQLR